jgi:multidrug efflux system membrane fusion protein
MGPRAFFRDGRRRAADNEKERGMKTLGSALAAGGAVLLALLLPGCGPGGNGTATESIVPVKLSPVAVETTSPPIHTSGKLSAVLEARLSFKVGGIIRAVNFDEGETAGKGDVLAELMLDEISAQAEQARSGYEKAERDYRRAQNLYADSVIALERLQDAETGLAMARSAKEIAEFNLHYSSIRAPADGKVLMRYAEPNELVAPGQPVFLFGATGGEWILRAAVNDRELIRLRIGDPARVTFDAYPGVDFGARLSGVAEAADPMSGGYEIELAVEPGEYRLISGFVADIEIHPSTGDRYRVIPIDALVEADGARGIVYTVNRETRRARAVHIMIGHVVDGRVAVSSGLDDISEVVTRGAAYLADSSLVSISD